MKDCKKNKRAAIKDNQKKTKKISIKKYIALLIIALTIIKAKEYIENEKNIFQDDKLLLDNKSTEELYRDISDLVSNQEIKNANILLLDAIIKNKNLSQTEKELFYSSSSLLQENQYINNENIYHVLKSVATKYIVDESSIETGIKGRYNYIQNLITIINYDQENSKYQSYFFHEIVHCIFYNAETRKLPNYFLEGVTELLTNEYFEKKPFFEEENYPYEVLIVKQYCNMVGGDKVLEAYTKGDMDIIAKELAKVTDLSSSKSFLTAVEDLFGDYEYDNKVTGTSYDEVEEYITKYITTRKNLNNNLQELEESIYNLELLSKITFEDSYNEYLNYIIINGVYIKAYFSEELQKKYQEPYIEEQYREFKNHILVKNNNH